MESDIDLLSLQKSLPPTFEVVKEDDGIYIIIPSEQEEDEGCQALINRELDRYFFLTWVKIRAKMERRAYKITVAVKQTVYGPLPEGLNPQVWSDELPTQLRLWALAIEADDLVLKAILFFQIIELTYPLTRKQKAYVAYKDTDEAPEPLTEAKLVRDWVTHSGEVGSPQLKKYCEYLEVPEQMFNRNDSGHIEYLKKKLNLLQTEAENVISIALSVEDS